MIAFIFAYVCKLVLIHPSLNQISLSHAKVSHFGVGANTLRVSHHLLYFPLCTLCQHHCLTISTGRKFFLTSPMNIFFSPQFTPSAHHSLPPWVLRQCTEPRRSCWERLSQRWHWKPQPGLCLLPQNHHLNPAAAPHFPGLSQTSNSTFLAPFFNIITPWQWAWMWIVLVHYLSWAIPGFSCCALLLHIPAQ